MPGRGSAPTNAAARSARARPSRETTSAPGGAWLSWARMKDFAFRRINALPPYAFAEIDALKIDSGGPART